jgi:hypothetical protein
VNDRLLFAANAEKQAAQMLGQALGENVQLNGSAHGFDLFSETGTTIEVKAARPSEFAKGRIGWQFLLKRKGRRGVVADLLFLLCYTYTGEKPIGGFIIPRAKVVELCKITIPGWHPKSYKGKYTRYYVGLEDEIASL